jgi:hypothetical protein
MDIKEFVIISQSRDGRKAMLTYKSKDKKSVTRHVRRVINGWEYKVSKKKTDADGNEVEVPSVHEIFVTAGK